MISVSHLSKSFGSNLAVDDLSFEVNQGEIVGFLGPNGAGKTTTLRLITGFLSPDKGSVTINDIPVITEPIAAQQHIGYLPENNPLYYDMLVGEILDLSADLKNIPKEEKKEAFDFVVDSVGISDVFYRPVNELSKGYKQRVGIAIALLHQPKILIMDEPTEGLDPNQRTEIRTLIKKLSKNHTIVMSTHVMQEVSAVCNRMVIINKGKLVADGTPQELTRMEKGKSIIQIELEGSGVIAALKQIPDTKISDLERSGKKIRAKLVSNSKNLIQPQISKQAHKNDWIIWKLNQEEQNLEDIFRQLTSN